MESQDTVLGINAPQPGEVHVWRIAASAKLAEVDRLSRILSDVGSARIKRRPDESTRRALTICWGRAREILAAYLQSSPKDVRLRRDCTGRPALEDETTDLRFSLSHSGSRALLAVTRGLDVGIDIERIRHGVDVLRLAERFFTPAEARHLLERGEKNRLVEFFRLWTRKEALVKLLGLGVPGGLHRYSVLPGADGRLVVEPAGSDAGLPRAERTARDLQAPKGYAAAISVACEEPCIRVFDASLKGLRGTNDTMA